VTTYAPQSTDPKAPFWAVTGSHLAGALVSLGAAVNEHWPKRDHASDGFIGDARHVAEGSGSDHNPWLNHTVRAGDFDSDGINADWFAEQLRQLGAAGDPRLAGGGYVIWNRKVTAPDFSHWLDYHGADDHTGHVHVSLSRNPAGYEDARSPWAFFASTAQQPAHPARVWAPGKDATGHDAGFRAHYGDEGPEVAELQHELNQKFPAYSHLDEDGVYGQQTAAVLDQFSERAAADPHLPATAADRQALRDSDGRDVGPRTARALDHYGVV
jgi:hypothetical protein